MIKPIVKYVLGCFAGLIVVVTACAPACADNNQPIELAAIFPQTGAAKAYGLSAWEGIQIAVDEINGSGGILGRPLALIIFDNRSTPLNARVAAESAVNRKVSCVIGDLWSTHSLAIAPVLQEAGIPMISPASTAPEVTRVGSYIFRTCYTDDFQGELMAQFALKELACTSAAVLHNISETYSERLAQFFVLAFKKKGGRILYEGGYKGNAVDFSDLLAPLVALAPQTIFIPGYARDSGLLIKQATAMGIKTVFIGGDAWTTSISDFAGAALEGSYFSDHWHAGAPFARNRHFLDLHKKMFGDSPIIAMAPLAYDAVWLFKSAVERCNSTDPKKIRDALAETKNFEGATGFLTFDENGDPIKKGAAVFKYSNGAWHFYKSFRP